MGRTRVPGSVNNLYPFSHSFLSFHLFFKVALIPYLILQYILMCFLTTSPTRMLKVKSGLTCFPGNSVGRDSAHSAGSRLQYRRCSLHPGSERPLGEGNGNSLQYSGKSHGQRSLVGYSLWDHKRVEHDLMTKSPFNIFI